MSYRITIGGIDNPIGDRALGKALALLDIPGFTGISSLVRDRSIEGSPVVPRYVVIKTLEEIPTALIGQIEAVVHAHVAEYLASK